MKAYDHLTKNEEAAKTAFVIAGRKTGPAVYSRDNLQTAAGSPVQIRSPVSGPASDCTGPEAVPKPDHGEAAVFLMPRISWGACPGSFKDCRAKAELQPIMSTRRVFAAFFSMAFSRQQIHSADPFDRNLHEYPAQCVQKRDKLSQHFRHIQASRSSVGYDVSPL